MGAEHDLLLGAELDVQRVLHRSRWMGRRDVQGLEVVPVVLDLGALGDAVAEPDEDVLELALDLRHEMQVSPRPGVTAEGQIEGRTAWFGTGSPELPAPSLHQRRDLAAVRPDGLAGRRSIRGRQLLDRLVDLGGGRTLPDERSLDGIELLDRGRGRDSSLRLRDGSLETRRCIREVHRSASASRRWRAASNSSTVAAVATFSDSAAACIGMVTWPSRRSASWCQPMCLVAHDQRAGT